MQNYLEQLKLPIQRAQNARTQVLLKQLPQYLNDKGRAAQGSMEAVGRRLEKDHGIQISRISLYKWAALHYAARLATIGERLPDRAPAGVSPKLWKMLRTSSRHATPLPPSPPPVLEVPAPQDQAALVALLIDSLRSLPVVLHELRELVVATRTNGNGNGNGNGHAHHEEGAVAVAEAPPAALLKAPALPNDWFQKPTEKKTIIELLALPVRTMGGWRIIYTPACCKDMEGLAPVFRPLLKDHLLYFVANPRDSRLHRRASRDVHSSRLRRDHGIKGCDLETVRIGRYRMYLATNDEAKVYHFTGLISNSQRAG